MSVPNKIRKQNIIIHIILFGFSLVYINQTAGQNNFSYTEAIVPVKGEAKIKYFPFARIVLIDSRFDTLKFMINLTGEYPASCISVSTQTISNYFDKALEDVPRGNKDLVLNVEQLRVTNATSINKKTGKWGINTGSKIREYVWFTIVYYVKNEDGSLTPKIQQNSYWNIWGGHIGSALRRSFNEIIDVAGMLDSNITYSSRQKHLLRGTTLKFLNNDSTIQFDSISRNVSATWSKYPITTCLNFKKGLYMNFDDFKENKLYPNAKFAIHQSPDCTFKLTLDTLYGRLPWAVADSNRLFIQWEGKQYLEMFKCNNTFCFFIPDSLPNMYQAFTKAWIKHGTYASSSMNTGSAGGDIVGGAISALVEHIVDKNEINKMNRNDFINEFRNCFIDMDTGDVIY